MAPYPTHVGKTGFQTIEFSKLIFAEREGFEPPVPLTEHLISNQAHSTTLTPLRKLVYS